MKKKLRKAACTAAAAAAGIAVPFTGFIAPSVLAVVHAEDPVTHHVKQGQADGFMYTESIIDTTKTGSIQIYKYEENNGKMTEGTGFVDENANKSKDNETRRPIKGVQFKGLKIADVVSVAGNDTVGTYYTNLNSNFTTLLNEYGLSKVPKAKEFTGADADKNGKYYTTDSIESAMKQLNEATVPATADSGADNEKPGHKGAERKLSGLQAVQNAVDEATGAVNFGYTDANGHAKAENLPLGLYLIAETDYKPNAILNKEHATAETDPSGAKYSESGEDVTGDASQNHQDVDVSSTPYLVSVPMTNVTEFKDDDQNTHAKGTAWFYDITTYPKNQTTNITKKIIDPDTKDEINADGTRVTGTPKDGATKSLEDYETYSIGDTVHQTIYADAAANMSYDTSDTDNNASGKTDRAKQNPNRYTMYSIGDEMQEGLQFDGVTKVVYGDKVADPKKVGDFSSMKELKVNEDYKVIKEPIKINPGTNTTFDDIQKKLDQALASADKPTDTQFCVQLTSKGIAKLNALTTESQVVVFFDSQVTPKAKIGTVEKNTNQARLEIKHEFTSTLDKYSNETRIFTFEIDAKKVAEEAVNGGSLPDDFHPEKTAFTVKQTKHEGDGWASKDDTRDATKNIQLDNSVKVGSDGNTVTTGGKDTDWDDKDFVKFVKEEDGVYHVYADKTDKAEDATTIIHPASDGKLIMKGLDDAKYTITERATQDHYSLQKASFDVDLTAATQTDTADYRSSAALTRQAKNALADEHVNGEIKTAKATADGTSTNLSLNSDNKGIANITIVNDKVVTLRTGGKGVTGIYIAAGAATAAVAAAYVIKRKKTQKSER